MPRFRITMMVPHSTIVEAPSLQGAAANAIRMKNLTVVDEDEPGPFVYRIKQLDPVHEMDFEPLPPEAA